MPIPSIREIARHPLRTLNGLAAEAAVTLPADAGRVLCVDDNEELLRGLVRQLGGEFHVVTASSARKALELIDGGASFDVIVSDLRMPGINGISFLNTMRQRAPDVERIILTGWIDPTSMAVARSATHANRLLTKPCPPRELRLAVGDALLRRRARRLRADTVSAGR